MAVNKIEKSPELKESEKEVRKRVSNIGGIPKDVVNVKKTINKEKEKIKELSSEKSVKEFQRSVNSILSRLGDVIGAVAIGTKQITIQTAIASKDVIKEYGKAISEDISFNKTNLLTMSLSKVSPLVGYFVTKLLDTRVFRNIFEKIKSGVGNTISSVIGKAKNIISFRKKEETSPAKAVPLEKKIPEPKEIPHLQTGGYIEKGGIAKVHPAEVVVPVEDILTRIDKTNKDRDTIFSGIKKILSIAEVRSSHLEDVVVKGEEERKKGFVASFKSAIDIVYKRQATVEQQMLKSTNAVRKALTGYVVSWKEAAYQMVHMNRTLKSSLLVYKGLRNVLAIPWKGISGVFKSRGGYSSHLPKGKNPLNNIATTTGMIYATSSYMLENITSILKDVNKVIKNIASALTGKQYEDIEDVDKRKWSIFSKGMSVMNWSFSKGMSAMNWSLSKITKKQIDVLDYIKFWKKKEEKKPQAEEKKSQEESVGTIISLLRNLVDILKLNKGKLDAVYEYQKVSGYYKQSGKYVEPYVRKRRIKSGEKTLEENMGAIVIDAEVIRASSMKSLKGQKEQTSVLKKLKDRLLKWGKSLWKWLLFGLMFIKDLIFKGGKLLVHSIAHVIGPIIRGIISKSLGGIGKLLKGIGSFFTKGGFTGVMGRLLKGPLQVIGLVIEGIGGWRKAKEWFGEKATVGEKAASATGAILGGTTAGFKGAAWGALKGAGVGAAVGSIVPIFGTGIGAAVGGLIGSVLGFIGGKSIAKVIVAAGKYIKTAVKAVWGLVMWPINAIKGIGKKIMGYFGKVGEKSLEAQKEVKKHIRDFLLFPVIFLKEKVLSMLVNIFGGIWNAIKEVYIGFGKGAITAIKGIGSGVWKILGSISTLIGGLVTADIDKIKKGIGGIISGIFKMIWGVIKGIGKAIIGVGKGAYKLIEGVGKAVWDLLTIPLDFVKGVLKKAKDSIIGVVKSGWKFVKGIFTKEEKSFSEKSIDAAKEAAKEAKKKAKDAAKASKIADKEAQTRMKDAIKAMNIAKRKRTKEAKEIAEVEAQKAKDAILASKASKEAAKQAKATREASILALKKAKEESIIAKEDIKKKAEDSALIAKQKVKEATTGVEDKVSDVQKKEVVKNAKDKAKKISKDIKDSVSNSVDYVALSIIPINTQIKKDINKIDIKDKASKLGETTKDLSKSVVSSVSTNATKAINLAKEQIEKIDIKDKASKLGETTKDLSKNVSTNATKAINLAKEQIDKVDIKDRASKLGETIKNLSTTIVSSISTNATKAVNLAKEQVEKIDIKDRASKLGETIKNLSTTIVSSISTNITKAINLAKEQIEKIDIKDRASKLGETIKSIYSNVISSVSTNITKAINLAKEQIEKIDIKDKASKLGKTTKDLSTTIVSSVSTNVTKVKSC